MLNRFYNLPIYVLGFLLFGWFIFNPLVSNAQETIEESEVISKGIRTSNGSQIENGPPQTSYTAYVNNDTDTILTEKAPRMDDAETKIDAHNSFFYVDLKAFSRFEVGSTINVRFTSSAKGEQNTYSAIIDEVPWSDPDPLSYLNLNEVDLPSRPDNVALEVNDDNHYTISWDSEAGYSYQVYRRNREDTVSDGRARYQYVKVAENIDGDSYTDTSTEQGSQYAYIVYSESSEGILSAHSEEVLIQRPLTGLTVESTTATNVTLSWDKFEVLNGKLAGYNIYRRTEGGTYGDEPVSYEGPDTVYTDSRLETGKTYYYKVLPRGLKQNEKGTSEEVQATTANSRDEYVSYANLKVAIVLYTNAPYQREEGTDYQMSESEIEDIKFLLEVAREYYWRNSKFKLNLEYEYIRFDEYLTMEDNAGTSTRKTAEHLADLRGVMSSQYDIIFRLGPSVGGNWSWGVTDRMEPLLGSNRYPAFAQKMWPYPSWVIAHFNEGYPNYFSNIDQDNVGNKLIWTYTHEMQHAIDNIYKVNGLPEMGHGDFPQLYSVTNISNSNINCCYPGFPEHYSQRYGKRFSFQSTMMRDFIPYEELNSSYGDIYEARDTDGDGMPDDDPRVPVDEERFGSSTNKADTDSDGLTDKEEAIDGIFEYSTADPNDPDTDGDGVMDGEDKYPRYPVDTLITNTSEQFTPSVDGDIEEWPEYAMVNDTVNKVEKDQPFAPKVYMAYSSDSLYMAMDLPASAVPKIRWDFGGNGYWFGAGNTTMEINPATQSFSELRTWDGSPDSRDYDEQVNDKKEGVGNGFWDDNGDYTSEFGRVFEEDQINLAVQSNGDGYHIEVAIPKNENANLTLEEENEIGFQIEYTDVFNNGIGAKTFDWWSYVYLTLSGDKATSIDNEGGTVRQFKLEKNYPNPFNPTTEINYTLPQSSEVELVIYNITGRKVETLVDGEEKGTGRHSVTFNAGNLSSGVYIYRLKAGEYNATKKMLLIK